MKLFAAPLVVFAACVTATQAAGPVTIENVEAPAAISADEPRAAVFSLEQAARSLDTAALDWQRNHACTACHTMLPYLAARPALNVIAPQTREVRQFFEEIVAGQREAMPSYTCKDVDGAVAIGIAWAMSLNDRSTTGKLHPLTRRALDRMWTLQREQGDWEWPFRDTPPLKINEHYGVTLAAIAAGMAPDEYATTPPARIGLAGIRRYLAKATPVSLHQQAMLLWASVFVDHLLSADDQRTILNKLMKAQRTDGGWSLGNLVDNTGDPGLKDSREVKDITAENRYGTDFFVYVGRDAVYKSPATSDGYATGFAVFVARQAGLPAEDARLQRAIEWLKRNQRESGRWYTPSQAWHTQNLISNAGTAYAVMALHCCGEVSPRTRDSSN